MKDDYFIFDNVVHMYDLLPTNLREHMGGAKGAKLLVDYAKLYSNEEYPYEDIREGALSVEDAHRMVFEESDTDMVVAQTVPGHGGFINGFSPWYSNHAFAAAYPEKVLFCGGVDPIGDGIYRALDEMERQVTELGAMSFKFYQTHAKGLSWKIDDRRLAYPLWEKALELGVTHVQFHKGLPFGSQHLEDLAPYDLQSAADDFPELTFIVHHLGEPFINETISVAERYENVWLAMSAWINAIPVRPRWVHETLGKCLLYVGADRLLWGSEAFVWPKIQPYIDAFANMEMPEDLQKGYGYPELTREIKAKIFGENYARLCGIDIPEKKRQLGLVPTETVR